MGGVFRVGLGALVALTAGCSVAPPVPLEVDPACAQVLGRAAPAVKLGVAPVIVSLDAPLRMRWPDLGVAAIDSGDVSSTGSARAPRDRAEAPALPSREYVWRPRDLDAVALQARLGQVLAWGLGRGSDVPVVRGPASDREVLARRAEEAGVELLVQAELTGAHAAWVDRDGAWFWTDAVVFYALGLPMAWVENEVFEVALGARVSVVHVRSGRALLTRSFVARAERSMNDPQRGWSLGGFFFLHPWTLDEDDLRTVYDALAPHAQKELERQVVEWLGSELPGRLGEPDARGLFDGTDARGARTFALVVGAPGPSVASLDRPPPLGGASRDAGEVRALLREGADVTAERLVELRDDAATRPRVLEALGRLGRRMIAADRLVIYYAGYGWFDAGGKAALLLDGEATLSLDALADAVEESVPGPAQVVFLLDTSFGGAGGRTYPGAPTMPDGALLPLTRRAAWQALVASAPGRAAHEEDGSGLFTRWLIAGARGAADADGDGCADLRELERYLRDWVRSEALERLREEQVPVRLGSSDVAPARLVRVPAPR